ncbi:MAG: PmoA family protein [Verrucomicrobiota bacterium]
MRCMNYCVMTGVLLTLCAARLPLSAADGLELRAEQKADRIVIYVGQDVFTEYLFLDTEKYPYFFPVNGPITLQGVTTKRETNYPHHSSLFFGCDQVNGGNYWQEGLDRGRIISKGVKIVTGQGREVVFEQQCSWERPGAESPFDDQRRIRLAAPTRELRYIDFEITLTPKIDVVIRKTNHSLFSARMKPGLSVKGGGRLRNAQGDSGEKDTFGKTSPWMDARGKNGDAVEGLAILNHPKNRWSIPQWFTRDYGFFSPAPMNWLDKDGLKLAKGEKLNLRYRVLVHAGDPAMNVIEAEYQKWAAADR